MPLKHNDPFAGIFYLTVVLSLSVLCKPYPYLDISLIHPSIHPLVIVIRPSLENLQLKMLYTKVSSNHWTCRYWLKNIIKFYLFFVLSSSPSAIYILGPSTSRDQWPFLISIFHIFSHFCLCWILKYLPCLFH